jgi:hypothetical protein
MVHAGQVCLDSYPNNDLRTEALHTWQGPWLEWQAKRKALKRAGAKGFCRVRTEDDLVTVVADRPFTGSAPVSPAAALVTLGQAIEHLARERQSLRFEGCWKPPPRVRAYRVVGRVHPDLVRAVAVEMGAAVASVPKVQGVAWVFPQETEPRTLEAFLEVLRFLSAFGQGRSFGSGPKADTPDEAELADARAWARSALRTGPLAWTEDQVRDFLATLGATAGAEKGGPL